MYEYSLLHHVLYVLIAPISILLPIFLLFYVLKIAVSYMWLAVAWHFLKTITHHLYMTSYYYILYLEFRCYNYYVIS